MGSKVESLQNQIAGTPKVAFSVSLPFQGYTVAAGGDVDLAFDKVITNVGKAYDDFSGFFIAPVKGVYYFRFTVRDNLDDRQMAIRLCKNEKEVIYVFKKDTNGFAGYLSSGVVLQLEAKDKVNLQLPFHHRVHEATTNHNLFTGFLLFPL